MKSIDNESYKLGVKETEDRIKTLVQQEIDKLRASLNKVDEDIKNNTNPDLIMFFERVQGNRLMKMASLQWVLKNCI